ncbi:MAG: hypothetical protein H7Z42_07145 [Roseiflexaceae bacterium]|nr:hypothetical protein [Roseiflexaceae bacterium]
MAKAGLLFVGTDDGVVLLSDPGASGRWLRIGHGLRGQAVRAVWPLYETPDVVLAGGDQGLWRSADGGRSWQQFDQAPVLAFDGAKTTAQQVIVYRAGGGSEQSDDGGSTWTTRTDSSDAPSNIVVMLVGTPPAQLALTSGRIARSADNGATWQQPTGEAWESDVTTLAAARYHIDTVYAGSEGGQLGVSSDRGATWQILKRDLPAIRAIVATRLA